jgi:hypothetical protein
VCRECRSQLRHSFPSFLATFASFVVKIWQYDLPLPCPSTRIPKGLYRPIPRSSQSDVGDCVRCRRSLPPLLGHPKSSQTGPVHARCSRGWAEIGVDFIDQAPIGVDSRHPPPLPPLCSPISTQGHPIHPRIGRGSQTLPSTKYHLPSTAFFKDLFPATWAAGCKKHFRLSAHCIVFCSLVSREIRYN